MFSDVTMYQVCLWLDLHLTALLRDERGAAIHQGSLPPWNAAVTAELNSWLLEATLLLHASCSAK